MNPSTAEVIQGGQPSRNDSAPPEGSEGVLPLPPRDDESEKPSRADQIGEGSYEGTDGYAKRIASYLRTADVEKDAVAAQPRSAREARDLLDAESEAASHSRAPGK